MYRQVLKRRHKYVGVRNKAVIDQITLSEDTCMRISGPSFSEPKRFRLFAAGKYLVARFSQRCLVSTLSPTRRFVIVKEDVIALGRREHGQTPVVDVEKLENFLAGGVACFYKAEEFGKPRKGVFLYPEFNMTGKTDESWEEHMWRALRANGALGYMIEDEGFIGSIGDNGNIDVTIWHQGDKCVGVIFEEKGNIDNAKKSLQAQKSIQCSATTND